MTDPELIEMLARRMAVRYKYDLEDYPYAWQGFIGPATMMISLCRELSPKERRALAGVSRLAEALKFG